MYLAEIFAENFRAFGSKDADEHLQLSLSDGLNVLVGENDSGKSSIVDAVRLLLSARGQDALRLTDDDFNVGKRGRASTLTVRGTFKGISDAERSRFLEWLSFENGEHTLVITLTATRRDIAGRARRIFATTRTGRKADGPPFEGEVRDFLQPTYLRPLRDAEAELSGGRGSRLSQILEAHPDFKEHAKDDSKSADPPATLVGIMRKAEANIERTPLVKETADRLSQDYLKPLSIGAAPLTGSINIARDAELRHILEKLELWLRPDQDGGARVRRGLGLNNILFMAAELLMLTDEPDAGLSLLLVEEPEAHLHPQLQARLIEFLEKLSAAEPVKAATTATPVMKEAEAKEPEPAKSRLPVQVLLTTHSPHFASKVDLERLIIVSGHRTYPLTKSRTKLAASDYAFLRRFLDVTKANLFFARGVLIVEGDAENLLLPVLARKLGRPLSEHGVSIVNVGSRALARYARIFQRTDGTEIDVRVASVTDLDIVPVEAEYARKKKEDEDDDDVVDTEGASDNGKPKVAPTSDDRTSALQKDDDKPLRTFVSPHWTLEHDLAATPLAPLLWEAITIGARSKNRERSGGPPLSADDHEKARKGAATKFLKLQKESGDNVAKLAAAVYRPLYLKKASKAEVAELLADRLEADARTPEQLRAELPKYLVEAIDYVTRNVTKTTP